MPFLTLGFLRALAISGTISCRWQDSSSSLYKRVCWYRPYTTIQTMHDDTNHIRRCKPCTTIQTMHDDTSHARRYKPCTTIQAMHDDTSHARRYKLCTTIQAMHDDTNHARRSLLWLEWYLISCLSYCEVLQDASRMAVYGIPIVVLSATVNNIPIDFDLIIEFDFFFFLLIYRFLLVSVLRGLFSSLINC